MPRRAIGVEKQPMVFSRLATSLPLPSLGGAQPSDPRPALGAWTSVGLPGIHRPPLGLGSCTETLRVAGGFLAQPNELWE